MGTEATGTESTSIYGRFQLTSKTHIRILEPVESHKGSLSFNLRVTDLSQKPKFWAVSYTWGQPKKTENIVVAGQNLKITKNLLSALHEIERYRIAYRQGDTVNALWIDQISINQEDSVEKGIQVALMPQIYSSATIVLVYLGNAPDAGDAVNLITSMAPHIDKQIARHEVFESIPQISTDELNGYNALNWKAFQTMLRASWFVRAWVVQEVGLAAQAIALYGNCHFTWHSLMNLLGWLSHPGFKIRQHHRLSGWTTRQMWASFDPTNRSHTRELSQYSCLDFLGHTACTYKATRPQDHLYAFLGHPSQLTSAPGSAGYQHLIEPNYESSIREVYISFAKTWLERYRQPHLLSCVNHEYLPLQLSNLNLNDTHLLEFPSWCPRWHHLPLGGTRFHTERGYLGVKFNASASTAFDFQLLPGDRLQIRGFCFDKVAVTFPTEDQLPPISGGKMELSKWSEDSIKTVLTLVHTCWNMLNCRQHTPDVSIKNLLADFAHAAIAAFWPGAFAGLYNPLAEFKASVNEVRKFYSDLDTPDSPYESALDGLCAELNTVPLEYIDPTVFISAVQNMSANRRFFMTESGRVGLGPLLSQVGDACYIISGADVPYILRPLPDSNFILVGESHVPCVMRGEAVLSTKMRDSMDFWQCLVLI